MHVNLKFLSVQIIVEDGMRSVPWLALVVLLIASPLQVDAQQITGTVRDQATGSPVANAQVFIEALNLGVLTQASGQYLLLGVPAGTHTVTVSSLGYRTETNEVTVSEGGDRRFRFYC